MFIMSKGRLVMCSQQLLIRKRDISFASGGVHHFATHSKIYRICAI